MYCVLKLQILHLFCSLKLVPDIYDICLVLLFAISSVSFPLSSMDTILSFSICREALGRSVVASFCS